MKLKYLLRFSLVCGISVCPLISCKDKTEPAAAQSAVTETAEGDESPEAGADDKISELAPATDAEKLTPAIPVEPVTPPVADKPKFSDKEAPLGYVRTVSTAKEGSLEELADKAGFAQYLPKDSELYTSYIGVESMVGKLRGTQIGKFIEAQMGKDEVDLDEVLADDDYRAFMDVAGEEVFFATGKGSASMLDTIMQASVEINKWQYQMMFKMMLSEFDPELFNPEEMQDPGAMVPSFLKDKDGAVKMLNELEIAPMYVGFKVSDKKKRAKYIDTITAAFNEMINQSDMRMMKAVKSSAAGGFYGFQWSGKGFLQMMDDMGAEQESMIEQMLGADLLAMYKKEIAKKNLVTMVGSVGDYVVIYVGKDAASLKFEKSVDSSLLSNPEMAFAKKHADKEMASLMYFSKSTMAIFKEMGGTLDLYANSFSNVLKQTEAFGDTRLLRDLLSKVGETEKDLYKMMATQRVGLVATYDEGLKIDMYLGEEYPSLDLDTPRDLAKMVNHPDAAIYASWISSDEYSEKAIDHLVSIWNAAYEGARLASEVQHDDPEWVEFQNAFKMFDKNFAADLKRIWDTINDDFAEGVGSEFGMMMDLKGTMPRVPKVPSVILENGEIPRVTIVKPVEDRAKISTAWDRINVTSIDIATTLEQVIGQEIEMLKPERAKRYGLDTWSYQLGVTSKDANLAVALNDDYWFMTSAPTGLEDLTARAYSKNSKQAPAAAEIVIRMEPLRVAARKWLAVIEEHGEELGENFDLAEFQKSKPLIEEFLKASEEFELIDSYTRKEAGEVQSTIHFKMK